MSGYRNETIRGSGMSYVVRFKSSATLRQFARGESEEHLA